jgi:hypothetical protein
MPGRGHQLLHSDAHSAELEALGLGSSLFGAAGVPAPVFQALVPRRAGVFDEHAHTFGTVDEPASFARLASSGLYRDASGILQTAVADVIRPEHDAAGNFLGYLFEPAATNFCRQSNAFSTSPWGTGLSPVLTSGVAGAPNGQSDAWTLEDNDTTVGSNSTDCARVFGNETVASSSDPYIFSVFVKKTSGTPSTFPAIGFSLTNGVTDVICMASLNTATGAVTPVPAGGGWAATPAFDASWSEDYGDWWRISLRAIDTDSGNTLFRARFYPAYSATLGGAPDGSLTGSLTVWQCDCIKGARVPSSPIATAASSVTRAADTLSWGTLPAGFSQSAGSLTVKVALGWDTADLPNNTIADLVGLVTASQNLAYYWKDSGGTVHLPRSWGGTNAVSVTPGTDPSRGDVVPLTVRWSGTALETGSKIGGTWAWAAGSYDGAFASDNVLTICEGIPGPVWIKDVRLFNRYETRALWESRV